MWYDNIQTLEKLIEGRNQISSDEYEKQYREKCQAIDRAVKAKILTKAKAELQKEEVQKKLVKSIKWFNKFSIGGRIETECPILLRDSSGQPIISAATNKPITGPELIENAITNPDSMTGGLIDFLCADLDVHTDILLQLQEKHRGKDLEEPIEEPGPKTENVLTPLELYLPQIDEIHITNKNYYNVVINFEIKGSKLIIDLCSDSKSNLKKSADISLRQRVLLFVEDDGCNENCETKVIKLLDVRNANSL